MKKTVKAKAVKEDSNSFLFEEATRIYQKCNVFRCHTSLKFQNFRRNTLVSHPRWKTCMLRQISLAWRNVKNNRRTIGLLSLDNWRGVNLWRNKNELSTLVSHDSVLRSIMAHFPKMGRFPTI